MPQAVRRQDIRPDDIRPDTRPDTAPEAATGRVLMAWSGGKDSTLALHELKAAGVEIAALLTTVTADYGRISMHGVRVELLERQAAALNLPLHQVFISKTSSNEEYEARMGEAMEEWRGRGVTTVAFGDIFLEDLRRYRERNLARAQMQALFPLWGQESAQLAGRFIALGYRAVLSCVDSKHLGSEFAGREYDKVLLAQLPAAVDPCGENGEFHSFVYGGPLFREPVALERGDIVLRGERFYYCDLIPAAKER